MIELQIKLKEDSLNDFQQFIGTDVNGLEVIGYIKWLW